MALPLELMGALYLQYFRFMGNKINEGWIGQLGLLAFMAISVKGLYEHDQDTWQFTCFLISLLLFWGLFFSYWFIRIIKRNDH